MKFSDIVKSLTPERYEGLKRAVELGKWHDGRLLTQEERETSLQILIAYDAQHKAEQDRIGYVHTEKKTACEHDDDEDHHHHDDPVAAIPLKTLQ